MRMWGQGNLFGFSGAEGVIHSPPSQVDRPPLLCFLLLIRRCRFLLPFCLSVSFFSFFLLPSSSHAWISSVAGVLRGIAEGSSPHIYAWSPCESKKYSPRGKLVVAARLVYKIMSRKRHGQVGNIPIILVPLKRSWWYIPWKTTKFIHIFNNKVVVTTYLLRMCTQ